jgi:hypothetical protein
VIARHKGSLESATPAAWFDLPVRHAIALKLNLVSEKMTRKLRLAKWAHFEIVNAEGVG